MSIKIDQFFDEVKNTAQRPKLKIVTWRPKAKDQNLKTEAQAQVRRLKAKDQNQKTEDQNLKTEKQRPKPQNPMGKYQTN